MINPLVTIVTPTAGTKYLRQAIESVAQQTYKNIQHLVVVDGQHPTTGPILSDYPKVDVIQLPYATGTDKYNGHRIYGASTYLARGEYLCFLDEDNYMDSNHIESLVEILQTNTWAYSLRKIVDAKGKYICNDDCESLGKWTSIINDNFVDVNCYIIPRQIALQFSPGWYRRARHPQEQPEVDRLLHWFLQENKFTCDTNGLYTMNYRAGNTETSVQKEFFLNGNKIMNEKYDGELPWRKEN